MENEKILNNEVFCVMPWTHLGLAASGQPRPCCWSVDDLTIDGKSYHVSSHDVSKHSILEPIKKLKENMLAGKKSNYCQRCYDQEALTGVSKRTVETFTHQIEDSKKIVDGLDVPIKELEFRLGNMCNLGCISCSPFSSNFFIKEIKKQNTDVSRFSPHFQRKYLKYKDETMDWYKDPIFWKKMESYLSDINYIYLAGGEPTIIPENWNFLEKVIDLGYAKNIKLGISTNLTNVQDKHINVYNSFKKTLIYCSIDGYEEVNNYIRYPSKWSAISKNLEKLLIECNQNVELILVPVLSIFSIWNFDKLWNYTENFRTKDNRKIKLVTNTLLRDPAYMSLTNLPSEAKEDALRVIEKITDDQGESGSQIKKLKNYIQNSIGKENLDIFHNGRSFVEQFDKMRGNSWQQSIPELKKYWKVNEQR